MQTLPLVMLGFLLGMLHATDGDHVVAVSTIVSRHGSVRTAARVGLLWGVGHTLTVFTVGAAIILLNLVVSPRLELALEFCVAVMLMGLGLVTLARVGRQVRSGVTAALAERLSGGAAQDSADSSAEHQHTQPLPEPHLHLHRHGDYVHAHKHGHGDHGHGHAATPLSRLDRQLAGLGIYQALRPLAIGIVHGLAGSAAVALLVLTQIREPLWAVAYLLLFGLGTTAGMVLITALIAVPFARSRQRPLLHLSLQVAAGVLSLGLGAAMAWKFGVSDGLFVAVALAATGP